MFPSKCMCLPSTNISAEKPKKIGIKNLGIVISGWQNYEYISLNVWGQKN